MIKAFDFNQIMDHADKVLENDEAIMVYLGNDYYIAASKALKGKEYSFSGLYYNSTSGNFKKCKKAFEKYSPKMMNRN